MAVDTRDKRASAQGFLFAPLPLADAIVGEADRAHVAWVYAGVDYTVTSAVAAAGGNLVKPRLHQGNAPGRKEQAGHGEFFYTLTITGSGAIDGTRTMAPVRSGGFGEIRTEHSLRYTQRTAATGTVCARAEIAAIPTRSYTGVASEDLAELALLGLLPGRTS